MDRKMDIQAYKCGLSSSTIYNWKSRATYHSAIKSSPKRFLFAFYPTITSLHMGVEGVAVICCTVFDSLPLF